MSSRGVIQIRKIIILILIIFSLITPLAYSHPGRTDSNGCHYCRTNCEESWGIPYGFYHRHNPVRACFEETITTSPPTTTPAPTTTAPPTTTPPTTTPTPTTTMPPTTTLPPNKTVASETTPPQNTTVPEPTLYESDDEYENGACGPSVITLLAMLPLAGFSLLRRK